MNFIKIDKLNLLLYTSLLVFLCLGFAFISDAEDWILGQNRIQNSDFEGDEIGKPPEKWELVKGG